MLISNSVFNLHLAYVAGVSVGLGSKERSRNGILPARNWGESVNSLPLNPAETLPTQANLHQQ